MKSADKLWGWLIPVLLAMSAFGAYNLNMDAVWRDELTTIFHLGGVKQEYPTLAGVLNTLANYSQVHMPGYFLWMAGWARLVGWSPFALRAMSLFVGLLAVCCTYRLARSWLSPRAGVYAALLMTFNAYFIYYSHELRMYTMLALFTVFTLWMYRRIVTSAAPPRLLTWLLFGFGAVGTLGTHIYGAIILATVGLYHLLFVSRTKRWWLVWLVLIVTGLIYLPWMPVIIPRAGRVADDEILGEQALNPVEIVALTNDLFANGFTPLLLVVLGFALYALRTAGRPAREIWFVAAAACVLTLIANQLVPIITLRRARYLIHLWPLLALLAGLGLVTMERLFRRRTAVVMAVIWVGFGIASIANPAFLAWMDGPAEETLPLHRILSAVEKLVYRDEMYFLVSHRNTIYERGKTGISAATFYKRDHDASIDQMTIQGLGSQTPDVFKQEVLAKAGDRMRVWLVYQPDAPTEVLDLTRHGLSGRYTSCGTEYEEPGFRIDRYDLAAFGCLPMRVDGPPLVTFDMDAALQEVRLFPLEDHQVAVLTAWNVGAGVPPETYSVSLKVWNSGENHVALADFGLRYPGFGWQRAVIPTGALPPGHYNLTVTVYNWKTGEQRTGSSRETSGTTLPLLSFDLPLQTSSPD